MNTTIEGGLQSLLRGEIAAAETYQQVLEGSTSEAGAETLRALQKDHGDAIRYLNEQLAARGAEAPSGSGMWGGVARAVEGTAKLFGDRAALRALREGELRGLEDYRQVVDHPSLPKDVRDKLHDEFIPAQRRHLEALDRLIEAAG